MIAIRKILSVFLVILMVFLTIGFQLHYHTCGKNLHNTYNLIGTPECACESDVMKIDDACCELDKDFTLRNAMKNGDITHSLLDSDCCENNLIDLEISQIFLFSVQKNLIKVSILNDFMSKLFSDINLDDTYSILTSNKLSKVIPIDIARHILRESHLFCRKGNPNDLYSAVI